MFLNNWEASDFEILDAEESVLEFEEGHVGELWVIGGGPGLLHTVEGVDFADGRDLRLVEEKSGEDNSEGFTTLFVASFSEKCLAKFDVGPDIQTVDDEVFDGNPDEFAWVREGFDNVDKGLDINDGGLAVGDCLR